MEASKIPFPLISGLKLVFISLRYARSYVDVMNKDAAEWVNNTFFLYHALLWRLNGAGIWSLLCNPYNDKFMLMFHVFKSLARSS